jgi:hypothetical protein
MIKKFTTVFSVLLAVAFLIGLGTTLTRSPMITGLNVLPVYIFNGFGYWNDDLRSFF